MKNKAYKLLIPIFCVFALSSCLRGNNDALSSEESINTSESVIESTADQNSTSESSKDEKSSEHEESSEHKHTWTNVSYTAPTCTEEGIIVRVCTSCGETKETILEKADHTYVSQGHQSATCKFEGYTTYVCSVCGTEYKDYDEPRKEHDFQFFAYQMFPTSTSKGIVAYRCSNCTTMKYEEVEPLSHEYHLVSESSTSSAESPTKIYSCDHCNEGTRIEFNIEDLTSSSKEGLVIDENGGAKFWGRPIGNDVNLDEDGNASSEDHVAVFNENQEGNYFEMSFYLTRSEASLFKNSKLSCTAYAARYMKENNMDFWANNRELNDWTPGMYIEDTSTHNKGDVMYDFRYALYVDGEFQDLDKSISTPALRYTELHDYELPYTFNLHEGVNTIRLAMAGGYKSTFHKFSFVSTQTPEANSVLHLTTEDITVLNASGTTYERYNGTRNINGYDVYTENINTSTSVEINTIHFARETGLIRIDNIKASRITFVIITTYYDTKPIYCPRIEYNEQEYSFTDAQTDAALKTSILTGTSHSNGYPGKRMTVTMNLSMEDATTLTIKGATGANFYAESIELED